MIILENLNFYTCAWTFKFRHIMTIVLGFGDFVILWGVVTPEVDVVNFTW